MRAALTSSFHLLVGVVLTLISTFVSERSAVASYSDIMGCEAGCGVVATGWPLAFIQDYLGMSVVGTADIMEVWFAADRFFWPPFLIDVGAWALTSALLAYAVRRRASSS